jgi:hypothetical protein
VSIKNGGLPNGRYSVINLNDVRYSIRLCVLWAPQLLATPHFVTGRCKVMCDDQEGTNLKGYAFEHFANHRLQTT